MSDQFTIQDKDNSKNDALGNPIIFGKKYGTVSKYDGKSTVVVGIAEKLTSSGNITLRITKRTSSEGGLMVDRTNTTSYGSSNPNRTVTHYSVYLFPVND